MTRCSISRTNSILPDWMFNIKTPSHFACQYQEPIPLCPSGCSIPRLHPTLPEWVSSIKNPSHFTWLGGQYQDYIPLHKTWRSISGVHPTLHDRVTPPHPQTRWMRGSAYSRPCPQCRPSCRWRWWWAGCGWRVCGGGKAARWLGTAPGWAIHPPRFSVSPETARNSSSASPETAGNSSSVSPETAGNSPSASPETAGNSSSASPETAGNSSSVSPETAGNSSSGSSRRSKTFFQAVNR